MLARTDYEITEAENGEEALAAIAKQRHKILRGNKPADLPVEQPTKVDFVINAKIAKQLRFTIPASLLVFADRVID
jgi:putative ABC transport system substrate-binding protein